MEEDQLINTYRECIGPLYTFVSRRCGADRGLAEDVTQETWLRALASWRSSGPPTNPPAWLRTVARTLLLNYYRRAPLLSIETLPSDWESRFSENGSDWDTPGDAALLNWGLARMNQGQARLLEAFHLDGRPVREIAQEMGVSERAVEGRLRRARSKLRKKLEPLVRSEGGPR